uniref:Centrosomal protein of 170 kDa-like isoform X2 n=1 Tax=Petromyzon marinus TaxID=7757 RepID=A0AAJ7TNY9_PETMA|nr:centrosomal protein of 170 kDa-like isoform X2 [Petromyzon marinus]
MSETWWFLVGAGGTRHRLPRELIFAGREDCELVLHSRSVDKQHAVINYDLVHDQHMLKDLGSLNGTFVNEVPVPDQTYVSLKQSDVIRFGYDPNVYTVEKGEHKVPEEALRHEGYSSTMQRLQEERGATALEAATSDQAAQDDGQAAAGSSQAPDHETAVDGGSSSSKGPHEAPAPASRGTPLYGRPSWWGESDGEWKGLGATDSSLHRDKFSGTDGAAMQHYPSPPDGASEEEAQKSGVGSLYMEGANGYAGLRREPSYFEIPTKELQREGSEPPTRDTDCTANATDPGSPFVSGPGHASFTIEFDENSPGKVTIRDHVPGAPAGSGGGGGGGGAAGSVCSGSPGPGQPGGRPRLSGRDSPRIAADGVVGVAAAADSKVADWLAQSGVPAACARRSARKAGDPVVSAKGEATANGKAFKGSKHEDGTQSDREDESVRGSGGGKGGSLRDALAKHRLEQQQARLRSRDDGGGGDSGGGGGGGGVGGASSPGPAQQGTPPAQRQGVPGHGAAFTIEFFFNEDDGNPRKRRSNSFSPGSAPEAADGGPLTALRGKVGRAERPSASPRETEPRGKPPATSNGERRSREGSPHTGETRLLSEKTFVSVSVGPRPELPRTSPDGDAQKNGDGGSGVGGRGGDHRGLLAEIGETSKVYGVSVNVSSSLPHTDKDGKTKADGITAASAALGWKDGKPELEWQSGLGGTIAVYPVTQLTGTDPLAQQARPVGPVAPSASQYRSQWASLATTPNGSWPSFPPGQDRPTEPTPTAPDKDADGGESCVSVRSSASDGTSSQSDRRRRALPQIPLERTHSDGIPTTAVGPFLARPSTGTGAVEEKEGARVVAADGLASQDGQTVAERAACGGNIWEIDVTCTSVKESASLGLRTLSAKTTGMQRSDAGDVKGGPRQPSQSDSGFSTPKTSYHKAGDEQRDSAGSRQQSTKSDTRPESEGGLSTRPFGDKPLKAIGLLNSSLQDEVLGRPRSASESRPTRPSDVQKKSSGKALVRQGSFTKERPSSLVPIEMLPHISTVAPAESQCEGTEARSPAPSSEAPKARSCSRDESEAKGGAAVGKDFSAGHRERSNGGETRKRNDSGNTASSTDTSLLLKETEAAVAALEAKLSVSGGWEGLGSPIRSPSPESDVDTSSTVSLVNGEGQRKAVTQRKASANAREKLSELRKARSVDPGAKADVVLGSRRTRPGVDRVGTVARPPSADWTTDDDRPSSSTARAASSDRASGSHPPPGLTSTDELMRTKLEGRRASAAATMSRGGGAVAAPPPRGGFVPTPPSSKPRPTRTSLMRRARLGDVSDNESGDVDRASVISDVSTTSSTGARPSPQPGPRRSLSRIDLLAQPRRPRVSSSRSDTEATVMSPASGRSSLGSRIAEAGRGNLAAARLSGAAHGTPGAMARSRTCSESRDREPRSRSSSSTHSSPSGTRWRHRLTDYTSTSEDEFGASRGGGAAPRYSVRMRAPGAPADTRGGATRGGPATATLAAPHHHHHHHRPTSGSSSSTSTVTSSRPHSGGVGAALPPRGAATGGGGGGGGGAAALGGRRGGGAAHTGAGKPQAKGGDEDYLRHWTVHSEEIARISKDLAKDLAILAREIHSVTGDPDGVSSSGTAPSTTGSTAPPTPGSSIDAREEVVLDTLMLTSIAQLSQRIRSATDKTTSKIRYLFKDQDLPWEAIESKLSFDGEVPLLRTTSRELTSILQDLRKVEKQLQVINFIIDPDRVLESAGTLNTPVTASTPARAACGYATQAPGTTAPQLVHAMLAGGQPTPAGSLTPMPAPRGPPLPFPGHGVPSFAAAYDGPPSSVGQETGSSLGRGGGRDNGGPPPPRLSLLAVSVDTERPDGSGTDAGSRSARSNGAGGADGQGSQG